MGLEINELEIWQQSSDPKWLLAVLGSSVTDRKLRLFGCAAARLMFPDLPESSQTAVNVAELYADDLATSRQLTVARRMALENALGQRWTVWRRILNGEECRWPTWNRRLGVAAWATFADLRPMSRGQWCEGDNPHDEAQLLRDIFGDVFRPVTLDPSWLAWKDRTVSRLARAIYDTASCPAVILMSATFPFSVTHWRKQAVRTKTSSLIAVRLVLMFAAAGPLILS